MAAPHAQRMERAVITAERFVEEARKLKGVPFRHQGHSRYGVDCMGLLYVAAANAGLDMAMLPQVTGLKVSWNYGRSPNPRLLEKVRAAMTPVKEPVPGCIVFFQFDGARHPQHFGIYTGSTIVHAHSNQRQVVEHAYRTPWTKWTHSCWLAPGVDYGR